MASDADVSFVRSFEIWRWTTWSSPGRNLDFVVPAWSAGTQIDMDVFGPILRIRMPAIHAGMTDAADSQNPSNIHVCKKGMHLFHALLGERNTMKHFVVSLLTMVDFFSSNHISFHPF